MPTYRAWAREEIETIYKVMKEHAPWRGSQPWNDAEFMASWLNNFQLMEQNSGHPTTEEELINWWKSTEEYQNEWPKWEAQPPDPIDPDNPPPVNPDEPAIPHPNPFIGQIRVNGSGYADDTGPILPIGLHLGDIFSKYTRDQRHVRTYLQHAVNAGDRKSVV